MGEEEAGAFAEEEDRPFFSASAEPAEPASPQQLPMPEEKEVVKQVVERALSPSEVHAQLLMDRVLRVMSRFSLFTSVYSWRDNLKLDRWRAEDEQLVKQLGRLSVEVIYRQSTENAQINFDYITYIITAGLIAGLGLATNNAVRRCGRPGVIGGR